MVHWPRAAIAFLWLFSPAVAQINFTWDPPNPVMGDAVTYTAVAGPTTPPVESWSWKYRYTSGACEAPWQTGYWAFGGSWLSPEPRPGTWEVVLTATFQSPGQDPVTGMIIPPPPPQELPKQVVVAPPTKIVIIAGPGQWANGVNGDVIFRYRVEAANRPCGPFLDAAGLAQEKLTNRVQLSPPFQNPTPPDFGWFPLTTPVSTFRLSGNEIIDRHWGGGTIQEWEQIPLGAAFTSATQLLQIKYTDPCGNVQEIPVGSVAHSRKKVTFHAWEAIATLLP